MSVVCTVAAVLEADCEQVAGELPLAEPSAQVEPKVAADLDKLCDI